ncbi:flagellar hook-associated protein FlgK [Microbacterium sp. GXF7504]
MSTFSGLQTAASGLAAARRAMDVVGQNIVNQTTEGYTRQRVTTEAVAAAATQGRFSVGAAPGQGVAVTGVARLGDQVLDARVRDSLAAAGHTSVRALAATTAEAALAEPTEDGLAARLSVFWNSWQDLANQPTSGAAAAVVIESGREVAAHLATAYRSVATQWSQTRETVDRTITDVNAAAEQVAALNRDIRDALSAGRSANELIDQRAVLAQTLAYSAGVTAGLEADGTMTLRLDGNALVSGDRARTITASGAESLEAGERVAIRWADSGAAVTVSQGELGGQLSVLAPASDGGTLAELAASIDAVATTLAGAVNLAHRAGATATGTPGGDFFTLAPTGPAALGLQVAVGGAEELALAAPGAGAQDATNADAISQLGSGAGSPDRLWTQRVSAFAVATAGDVQRARLAETTTVTAVAAQQSVAAVDGDEETVNLVTYQAAYQAAARVVTAVDEALDTVINRMGLVGR